jgi:hypothetical protein
MDLHVDDATLEVLRELFVAVEGTCEAWTADEIVRRVLIRGAMDYAKAGGKQWREVADVASLLRRQMA